MPDYSKQVDVYIAKAAPFAQPILNKIRELYHAACPEIRETIKWGFPHFEHKGLIGHMAGFKSHAVYHFWNSKYIPDPDKVFSPNPETDKRRVRLTDVAQLPPDKHLLAYIKRAVAINETGIKRPPREWKKAKPLKSPRELIAALKSSARAAVAFKNLSVSCRNEYIEWISDAKQDATRVRRLATTIQWLEQGKSRNWKYEKK